METLQKIELAKKICIYNGEKGTEKQIAKVLKIYGYDYKIMLQFAKGRIL